MKVKTRFGSYEVAGYKTLSRDGLVLSKPTKEDCYLVITTDGQGIILSDVQNWEQLKKGKGLPKTATAK